MHIGYFSALGRAWARTKSILFPFRFDKWFGLGFCAWLATLGESASSSWQLMDRDDDRTYLHYDRFGDAAADVYDRFTDFFGSFESIILLGLVLVAILLALLVTWLSSRGHFMLLDGVVRDRSDVAAPWREYGHLGDSLFIWRLCFGGAAVVLIGGLLVAGAITSVPFFVNDEAVGVGVAGLILAGLVFLTLLVLFAFVEMLLYHFVVPLMYKHRVGVLDAWRSFLTLLRKEAIHFVLYALFLFVIYFVLGIAVVFVLLLTCCVSWIFMLLSLVPVIGAVIVLPYHVTWRGLGLEFLGQFGEEWRVLGDGPGDTAAGEQSPDEETRPRLED